jgi:hypothetical protein
VFNTVGEISQPVVSAVPTSFLRKQKGVAIHSSSSFAAVVACFCRHPAPELPKGKDPCIAFACVSALFAIPIKKTLTKNRKIPSKKPCQAPKPPNLLK